MKVWLFFTGDFQKPVKVPLDDEDISLIGEKDHAAWTALLYYIESHYRHQQA